MDENITYQNNLVLVNAGETKSVTAYARPTDTIRIPFDISKLDKKIVEGDLVISFYAGGKITIANYGVMLAQGQVPTIVDALGVEYTMDNLLLNNIAQVTTDDPDHYIVSRKISSADTDNVSGEELASSQVSVNAESDKEKFVGIMDVDQQNPVSSAESKVQPFVMRTLLFESKLRYDTNETFSYNGRTILNQEQPGTKPTPIQLVTPLVDSYYGAKVSNSTTNVPQDKSNFVQIQHGGGDLLGSIGGADYQYIPEDINLGSRYAGSIYLKADTSNVITRGMQVSLNGDNVSLREIRLDGLPDGVTILETEDYQVQPFGSKVAVLKPLTQGKTLDIYFQYEAGMPDTVADITMSIQGFNSKYNSLLVGTKGIKWEFKPVYGAGDIDNYNSLNIFTYSTRIDPLKISTGSSDDYVEGGNSDDIYYLLAGNDIFISGSGNETVNLGDGNNEFHVGYGNDKVTGGRDSDTIYFSDSIDINRDTNIRLNGGIVTINVTNNTKANSYVTTLTQMDVIYLDQNDNVINIDSTAGFNDFKIMAAGINGGGAGSQHDKIVLSQATYIDFDQGYLTTNLKDTNLNKVYYRDENQETLDTFVGSGKNDTVIGSIDYAFNYEGRGDHDTLRYDNILGVGLTFNAQEGTADKNGLAEDHFSGIEEVYGTQADDTFIASAVAKGSGITYHGAGGNNDIVTYENESQYGVTIDFTDINKVIVSKSFSGATPKSNDTLYDIDTVKASKAGDKFIVGPLGSNTYDGLDGKDELSYQGVNNSLVFDIISTSGTVDKGAGNVDTFSNMEIFRGGNGDDIFYVNDTSQNLEFYGEGGNDLLSYEKVVEPVYYVLDFTSGTGSKVDKYNDGGTLIGSDMFSSIERFVTGNYNDTFRFQNQNQLEQLGIQEINAGGHQDFTNGTRDSKGNVLEFTKSGEVDIAVLATRVSGFDSLVLLGNDGENRVHLAAANGYQFSKIFGNLGTTNTLDAVDLASNLTFTIDVTTGVTSITPGSDTLYFFDFNTYVGTSAQDIFNVTGKKDTSIYIDGHAGGDTLNYSTTTGYLTFNLDDINDIYDGSVNKGDDAHLDRFTGITNIVGGNEGNLFILSPTINYTIQGGDGRDTVSFENFTAPINSLNFADYSNIEVYKLTSSNDIITFRYEVDNGLDIDGAGGTGDSLSVETSNDLVFNIGITDPNNSPALTSEVILANGSSYFKNFEIINGSTGNDTFNIQTLDNTSISTSRYLYFMGGGGADTASYQSITSAGVTLVIGFPDPNNQSKSYLAVKKDNNSIDFYDKLATLTLTNQADTLQIDITTSYDYEGTSIDMGGGSDTLDFSSSSAPVNLDIQNNTLNGKALTIINWENVTGTNYTDTFLVSGNGGRIFDGGENIDTLDYTNVTETLEIDIINGKATYGNNNVDTFKNMERFVGAKGDTTFKVAGDKAYTIIGQDTGNYVLDYEGVNTGAAGFIFDIDATAGTLASGNVTKVISGSAFQDDFSKITSIEGTGGNDIFSITLADGNTASELSIDGKGGNNTLTVNTQGSTGITFDLVNHELLVGNTKKANIANFQTITGSAQGDTFIMDNTILTNGGILDGSDGEDTLDLTNITDNLTLNVSLDLLYLSDNEASAANIKNMETIRFGEASDTVIIADSSNSTLKTIDGGGGAGTDSISFADSSAPVDSHIQEVQAGSNSIELIGFEEFILTAFNDIIRVDDESIPEQGKSYTIDGYLSEDTIDYSEYTLNPVVIDIENLENITATRGTIVDNLKNFEIFKLNDGGSINVQVEGNLTFEGTGNNNTLGYDGYSGYILLDLSSSYIYKFNNDNNSTEGVDQFVGFTNFKGTNQSDTFRLKDSIENIANVTIDTGNGADEIDMTNINSVVVYTETNDGTNRVVKVTSGGSTVYTFNLSEETTPIVIGSIAGLQANSLLLGTTFQGQEAGLDNNSLSYATYTANGILVDFQAGTVSAVGAGENDPKDIFSNIYNITGTDNADTFSNLNSYTKYTLNGGDGLDTVDYTGSLVGITVTLDASGNASINKGGIQDNLTSIEGYAGTNNNDIFTVDISYFTNSTEGALIDGKGGGEDELVITGADSGIQLDLNASGTSTINGQELIAKNFNIYTLSDQSDTFTYHSTMGDSLVVNGNGGNDAFTLDNTEDGIVNIQFDYSTGSAIISSSYSLQLQGFTKYDLNSSSAITFNLNNVDFAKDLTAYTINFVQNVADNELRLNNSSNLQKIDIGGSIVLTGAGGNLTFNNLARLFVGKVTTTSNIAVNFDLAASNKNYAVIITNSIDLNVTGGANGGSIVFSGNSLALNNTTYNHTITFNDSAAMLTSTITTDVTDFKISGSNTIIPVGSLAFSTANSGNLDLSGYTGAMGDITIGSATATANGDVILDFNGNKMKVAGDTLASLHLANKNNNVILQNGSARTADNAYTIIGGTATDTIIVSAAAKTGNGFNFTYNDTNSLITIDSTKSYVINNFEAFDFSAFNGQFDGNTPAKFINISLGQDPQGTNHINRIIFPTLPNPSSYTSSTVEMGSAGGSLYGTISFIDDAAHTFLLMQFKGTYAYGSLDISNASLIRPADDQDNNIFFSYVSSSNLTTLLKDLQTSNIGLASLNAQPTNTTIDFSAWSNSYQGGVDNAQGANLLYFYFAQDGSNNSIDMGMMDNVANATHATSIEFSANTIVLPSGTVYIDSLPQTNLTIQTSNTNNPLNYVLFRVPTGGTLAAFNDAAGSGTTGTSTYTNGSYQYTFENVTMFQFDNTANTVTLGQGGSLYQTAKGRFYMDGDEVANDQTAYNSTDSSTWDTVDLSNVIDGKYYFSMTNWSSVQYNSSNKYLFSSDSTTPVNVDGTPNADALKAMYSGDQDTIRKYIQIGIGMVNYSDRDYIQRPDMQDTLNLFYAFKGVNKLIMTGGNDTFGIGKFYNYKTDNNVVNVDSPFKIAGNDPTLGSATYTKIKEVDSGGGVDELLIDQYYWGLKTGLNGAYNVRHDRTWHLQDNEITYDPGFRNHFNSGIDAVTFKDFSILTIDDTNDLTFEGAFVDNIWRGQDDDITVDTSNLSGNYYEVNLGGRAYNLGDPGSPVTGDPNAATPDRQTVTFTNATGTKITWGTDSDATVDSVINIRDNSSGKSYVFKNFDEFIYHNSVGDTLEINPINKALLNNKIYTIRLDSGDTVILHQPSGWQGTISGNSGDFTVDYTNGTFHVTYHIVGPGKPGGFVDDNGKVIDDDNSSNEAPDFSNNGNGGVGSINNGEREHTWWDDLNHNNVADNNVTQSVSNDSNNKVTNQTTLTLSPNDDTLSIKHLVGDIFNDIDTIDYDYYHKAEQNDVSKDDSNKGSSANDDKNHHDSSVNGEPGEEHKPNNDQDHNSGNSDLEQEHNKDPITNPGQHDNNVTQSTGNIHVDENKPHNNLTDNLTRDNDLLDISSNKIVDDALHQDNSILDFNNQSNDYTYALHTGKNDLDLAKLFDTVKDNVNSSPDLQNTIDTINSISEDLIHNTQKLDELDSISYALDDSHNSSNEDMNIAHSKKHSNDNSGNFGGN